MRTSPLLLLCVAALACGTPPPPQQTGPERPWRELAGSGARVLSNAFAPEDEPLAEDLGLTASGISDSLIHELLSHRLSLPQHVTVAVLHLRGQRALRYWPNPQAADISQAMADSATQAFSQSPRVGRASILPQLVAGEQRSVGGLREAAARFQADLLLIYRPSCRLYERAPFVGAVQFRATCTLEAVVLDTRSGLMPFSSVVTRERVTQRVRGEFQDEETTRRAQVEATALALREVGERFSAFLGLVPVSER